MLNVITMIGKISQSKNTGKEKLILAVIHSHYNKDNLCFVNTAYIASRLGTKTNAISTSIKKLLDKKILISSKFNTLKTLFIDFSHPCFGIE